MKKMVWILTFICFGLVPNHSFAQDVIQHRVNDSIQRQASKQTKALTQSLGLSIKQAILVEDKLMEFLIYKKKIVDSDLSAALKTKKLKNLLSHKFTEMHDILTQRQYDLFVKMK